MQLQSVLPDRMGTKSQYLDGAHFTMCNGSVRFLSKSIDHPRYQALGDHRDGVAIGEY